ncbi:SDR family oxidoreductase [Sphingobacterium sp.]|uniref:SDR family oxidoreductase n=1 Tax=Sphingobacterium sp. TaxID=341027 RepID=UPI002897688B|nr:SDR family oxidoreductase [Sphingobacterium sp.]
MLDCQNKRFLVAGATGYLGQYLVGELKKRGAWVRVLIRKEEQKRLFREVDDIVLADATGGRNLDLATAGVDWIISALGITRQRDGLTYMDVDYGANFNLLQAGLKSNIQGFQYVSAINGDKHRNLKIFEAKERFVDNLKASGVRYSIIRPNGFFSDMKDFLKMAEQGRIFLFGSGNYRLNPIHGEDLAKCCVDKLLSNKPEETIGGPDVLSQNDIARMALEESGRKFKIVHLPDWVRKITLWSLRTFTASKTYGPIEFFLTMMAEDTVAPRYGKHHLRDFFLQEAKKMT